MILLSATAMMADPSAIDRIGQATGCGGCRMLSEARSVMLDLGALRNTIVADVGTTAGGIVLEIRKIGNALQVVVAATA